MHPSHKRWIILEWKMSIADYEKDKENHQGNQALVRMPRELNPRATVIIPFRSSHEGSNSQASDDRAKPPHLPGPRWRLLFSPSFTCFLSPPSVFPTLLFKGATAVRPLRRWTGGIFPLSRPHVMMSPVWRHGVRLNRWFGARSDRATHGSSAQQPW